MHQGVLIMPGINNSGPSHWQSLWQAAHPTFQRIEVDDWDHPVCASWMGSIADAASSAAQPFVIVAHSLGCLPVIEWALREGSDKLRGLLLVSVPDPNGPNFPAEASGFAPLALQGLAVPCIVVSSTDDPFGEPAYARRCAQGLGARFVNAGAQGHINAASGLGDWPPGLELLRSLC